MKVRVGVEEQPARDASEETAASPAARVLVVDDEESVRLSVARVLRKFGYEVVTACDGAEALAVVCGEDPVELILMDVTMPVMDGSVAARELRGRGVQIPIVLMSGYAEEELVNRGVLAHVDGFVKKPFEVSELVAAVRDRLAQLV